MPNWAFADCWADECGKAQALYSEYRAKKEASNWAPTDEIISLEMLTKSVVRVVNQESRPASQISIPHGSAQHDVCRAGLSNPLFGVIPHHMVILGCKTQVRVTQLSSR